MKYRVTVTRTGFVYVDAKNKEEAEKYAEETAWDSDVWWDDGWDATDCQEDENNDCVDDEDYIIV